MPCLRGSRAWFSWHSAVAASRGLHSISSARFRVEPGFFVNRSFTVMNIHFVLSPTEPTGGEWSSFLDVRILDARSLFWL